MLGAKKQSMCIMPAHKIEVEDLRSLVGRPVFKTGEGDEKSPWQVRFL